MASDRPARVAILGGGCAAMAAAFELTRPRHAGRYQVTVYQPGWRLGGKGASGRGAAGRIEEHGLHVWLGWYDNAFRLMRECYTELGRDPAKSPLAHWSDAFEPAPLVAVTERERDGHWSLWKALFPATDGLPGDPYPEGPRWTLFFYVRRALLLLRTLFESVELQRGGRPAAASGEPRRPEAQEAREPDAGLVALIGRLSRAGALATLAALVQAVSLLESILGTLPLYPSQLLVRFLDAIARGARQQLEALAAHDPELGRLWTIADLTLATLRGLVRSGALSDPRGFDVLDEYDCREWLLLNGATQRSVESGYLRGLYDLAFAYEDGDEKRPRISAAQALRGMLRAFFTYRGAFFWKMQAGMGDAVFAPFYQVLRRRGVRFDFFHRLERVRLADAAQLGPGESPYVEALELDVQAHVRDGRAYEPLIDLGGVPSWPSAPLYDQLEDGPRFREEGWKFECFWDRRRVGTRTLRVGQDFDFVVLAVGLGAVPHVCRELVERDPRWRAMVDQVKTVATQAFQLWMHADLKELGWHEPPATVSAFEEPFDTWSDMQHLIPREQWSRPPRALVYFCGVLPDGGGVLEDPAQRREQVYRNAVRFLNEKIVHLWPLAQRAPGQFRWELLADPAEDEVRAAATVGEERFRSQFWSANVNPSDRYVLALPGSSRHRISPLDPSYDNLTLAGDWTECGFNQGCVEAAFISGRLAAHALSLSPALEEIVGFDHP